MASSWFDWHPIEQMSGISAHQAQTINRLMEQGVSLAEIATATGLPASLIQQATGYGMNGPNNQGGAEVEQAAQTTSDPPNETAVQFIQRWQREHPFSPQSVNELRDAVQAKYGYGRWQGTSNNELDLGGQKTKFWSEGGQSWFDPAGGTPEGEYVPPGGNQSLAQFNVQPYTFTPYQQPAPFSYPSYSAGTPFKAPSAEDVLNEPGVQFALEQGQKALEGSASARGTLNNPAFRVDADRLRLGQASTLYGNAFDRAYQGWAGNEAQRQNDYNIDRNNAYQNYAMNLGAGQTGYGLNANQSLAAFNANLNAQNTAFQNNRLNANDQYQQGQDYINNLFRYYTAGQGGTGVPTQYGSYV